jgi:D-beta-D-heptose 7-phosphate kinase / D-beta-D-heptose 1-phosphate adenosyltransferase
MKINNLSNQNKDILILGDIFLDIFQTTDTLKISPERPVPVLKPSKSINLLGGAANVANNIQSIGGSAFLISKLSNDATSRTIKKLLINNKIKFKIITNKDYSSPVKKRIVQNDHQFCRLDDENFFRLKKIDENKIVRFVNKNINKFQSLIISDYSKGFLTNDLIKKVINIFKKNNKKIYTDPKNRNIEVYKNSNFICPNQTEFYDFFDYQKLPFTKNSTLKLLKKTKADAFVVTKGSEGISVFFGKGKKLDIPQIDVNVYDVTGAGDTFIALLSYLLSNEIDLINSIKISSFACGRIVQKKHTAVLSFYEFQKIIEEFCENESIQLSLRIRLWKLVKLKIGVTNGCFDVLHSGHLHLLSEAKKNCDKLIVLLNSDKSIKKIKGKNRPMLKLNQRIKLLKMIKDVDDVEVFEEKTPEKIIRKILPNILFKGSDYKAKELIGYDIINNNGGKVKIIKKLKDFSSSKLI